MTDAGVRPLAENIGVRGQNQSITLYEGKILDGRARQSACEMAGVTPRYAELPDGTDPVAFVLSQNLHRRHLTSSQRATIAVDALPHYEMEAKERQRLSRGRGRKGSAQVRHLNCGKASQQAARIFGVGSRAIEQAKALKARAPEEFEAVKRGEKKLADGLRELAKQDYRRRVLAAKANPAPVMPTGPYDVIVADPPWQQRPCGTPSRRTENHYDTLTVDQICAHRPLAADNSVLFLWAIPCMLPEALRVMTAWGFTFVTEAVWDKKSIGKGYWFRNQHESVLIGRRGKFPPPQDFLRVPSVFRTRKRDHSRKPHRFYKMVEKSFDKAQKLEMYCRDPRPGWAFWGNEVNVHQLEPSIKPS